MLSVEHSTGDLLNRDELSLFANQPGTPTLTLPGLYHPTRCHPLNSFMPPSIFLCAIPSVLNIPRPLHHHLMNWMPLYGPVQKTPPPAKHSFMLPEVVISSFRSPTAIAGPFHGLPLQSSQLSPKVTHSRSLPCCDRLKEPGMYSK